MCVADDIREFRSRSFDWVVPRGRNVCVPYERCEASERIGVSMEQVGVLDGERWSSPASVDRFGLGGLVFSDRW